MAWDRSKPQNTEKLKDTPALIRANWDAIATGTDPELLITNDKISATANIADTKLAQITTASKVSGAALTSLASIPAGAGSIPVANIPDLAATKITSGTLSSDRLDTGTTANKILKLDGDAKIPAVDGSLLTNIKPSDLAIASQARGDILYFNGTNWVRLPKGTDGQYLKIGANDPAWGTVTIPASTNYSNLICSFLSVDGNGFTAPSTSYVVCFTGKFTKTASISTITFYARGKVASTGAARWIVKLDIGGLYTELPNGTGSGFMEQSGTLDVSSLTNGTVYDITVSLKSNAENVVSTLSKLFAYAS